MSFGITKTCEFHVGPDREVELSPISLSFDSRGTIHGTVVCKGKPVPGALVKLFKIEKDEERGCPEHEARECPELKPVAHMFTDKCGQFLFGVHPGHYLIKATLTKPCKDIDFVESTCVDP